MITLPQDYVTSIFLQYAGSPEKTHAGYKGSCPICMEGKSWGVKKRLFYFPKDGYFFCHNKCGAFSAYYWVKTVTGKSFLEIKNEVESGFGDFEYDRVLLDTPAEPTILVPDLPNDSINLLDKYQVKYNKDNYWVKLASSFIMKRKLLKAPYRPSAFYLSLEDFVHRNRLIIPYFGFLNKVEFYQSRALTDRQEKNMGKFLSKVNAQKSVFNLDKVDPEFEYIFLLEGPIDAMFIKNGVALSGAMMTEYQEDLIRTNYPFHKLVWLFDNHKIDKTAAEKLKEKIEERESLAFSWGGKYSEYKDFNEYCVKTNTTEVDYNEVLELSYSPARVLLG